MDYLYILLALLGFTMQFAFMGLYQKKVKRTMITGLSLTIFTNTVGATLFFIVNGFQIQINKFSLVMAILLSITMILYYIISLIVLSYGNLAVYSMFMMLGGMVMPFFYGVIFLKEGVTVFKIIGVILLSFFMILQSLSQKNGDKQGGKYILFCILIFLINGCNSIVNKAHQSSVNHVNEPSFIVLSCITTMLISGVILTVIVLKNKENVKKEITPLLSSGALILSVALGVVTYGANFLLLLDARTVPASVQFPIISGGVIVLSALADLLIFKRKLTKAEIISVIGAFVSTCFFAF